MHEPYFIAIFLAAWIGISYLLSLLSGWRLLSEQYQSPSEFSGRRFWFQSASMRLMVGYNGCLIVGANREGLHISVLFPFRIGHPPFFSPWDEISMAEKRGLFWGGIELRFARCPSIPFVISKRLMRKISDAAGEINLSSPIV